MQTISLDISNKGVYPCIYAKQSEVGRKFLAVIADGGVPYNIPENSLLSVWYEGDTDAGNYSSIEENSAFVIDGNKVTVELVAQMLLKPGNGELCLSITHGDGGETNTWNIPYCVEYKPGAGSSVPTEYYTALTEAGAMAAEQVSLARAESESAANSAEAAAASADAAEDVVRSFAEILAPVGYVFHWSPIDDSEVDLSTASKVHDHFGFGTWEQIKDMFLLSAGDNHTAGEVGGEETHTLTEEEMPSHYHRFDVADETSGETTTGADYTLFRGSGKGTSFLGSLATQTSGSGVPYNNMPPYLTVYTWKRIA